MPTASARDDDDDAVDGMLRALADRNRRALLAAVREEQSAVGELAERLGLSQQIASHHLGVLHRAGLVERRTVGTRHLFAVRTDGLAAVRDYLDGFWPAKLEALRDAVEANARSRKGHR